MFFKISVLKNFAIFLGKHFRWPLQAFFYRTPTVAACSKYFFSAESGIYCWQSHRYLLRTPLKTPLELFCKKGVLRNFAKFIGKHLCWRLFLIELQEVCSFIKMKLRNRLFLVEFSKLFRTNNLKTENHCFWNLFFHWTALFNNLNFWHKLIHMF